MQNVNAKECAAVQLQQSVNGCGIDCGCPHKIMLDAKGSELLASVRELNACLVACLTGGEVSAKRAGKAIETAALLIEAFDK